MNTEVTTRQPRVLPRVVSRSLQNLAPLTLSLPDARDRPVPLSSAGFVLRAGGKYKFRIVPPTDEDLERVRLNLPPEFISVGEQRIVIDEGRKTHEFPIRVKFELGTWLSSLRFDDVDVELVYRAHSGKQVPPQSVPIVVRPRGGPMIVGALSSAVGILVPAIIGEFIGGKGDTISGSSRAADWLTRPEPYLIVAGIVVVVLGVYGWSWYQLRQRTRDLFEQHQQRYPDQVNA